MTLDELETTYFPVLGVTRKQYAQLSRASLCVS